MFDVERYIAETKTRQPPTFPVVEPGFFYGYAGPLVICLNDGSGDQRRVWTRFVKEFAAAAAALGPDDRACGLFHIELGASWNALPLTERVGYLKGVSDAAKHNEAKVEMTSPFIVFCTKSILTRTALRTLQSFVTWMRRVAVMPDGLQGLKHLAKLSPEVDDEFEKLMAVYMHLVQKHAPGLKNT